MSEKKGANIKYIHEPLTPIHRSGNTKEADIVAAILRFLRTVPGCFAWKTHGGMYGTAGIPDIIACIDGSFFDFEVKTVTGKATPLQETTIRKILASGGTAAVVRSVDEVRTLISPDSTVLCNEQ